MSISIVVADPHPLILLGIRHLFAGQKDFSVSAWCNTAAQLLDKAQTHKPDVVVTEIHLPDGDGFNVLRKLHGAAFYPRVVINTASFDEREAREALRLGVAGVVLKNMETEMLVRCVRKVHAGGRWTERQAYDRLLEKTLQREAAAQQFAELLTERELEITRLVAGGLRNAEVAGRLGVTEGTIKTHLHSVFRKLSLSGRAELMLYAQRQGLV